MSEIDWQHRDSLRMWSVLAARGHEGGQAVAAHWNLAPPAVLPPLPAQASPIAVSATTPRAPRAPAAPVSSAIQGRVDALIGSPVPKDLLLD
jgi:hypothetical protein